MSGRAIRAARRSLRRLDAAQNTHGSFHGVAPARRASATPATASRFIVEEADPEDELQSRVARSAFVEGLCSSATIIVAILARTSFSHLKVYSAAIVGAPLLALCVARPIFGFMALAAGTWVWWHKLAITSRQHRLWYARFLGFCSVMNIWTLVAAFGAAGQLASLPRGTSRVVVSAQVGALCCFLLLDQLLSIAFVAGIYHVGDVVDATRPESRLNRRRVRGMAVEALSGQANAADMDPDYWSGDEDRTSQHRARRGRRSSIDKATDGDDDWRTSSDDDSGSSQDDSVDTGSHSGDMADSASPMLSISDTESDQDVYDAVVDLADALTATDIVDQAYPAASRSLGGMRGERSGRADMTTTDEFAFPSSPDEAATQHPFLATGDAAVSVESNREGITRGGTVTGGGITRGGTVTGGATPSTRIRGGDRTGVHRSDHRSRRPRPETRAHATATQPVAEVGGLAREPTWAELYPAALGSRPPPRSTT